MRTLRYRLVLASRSPRRREILREAQIPCMAFSSNSSELFDENLTLDANLKAIAKTKVRGVLSTVSIRNKKGIIILGADTIVCLGKNVLGKPKNRVDATRMLTLL